MAEPASWSKGPNLVVMLAKLQELTLRIARLELHQRTQRLTALVQANKR